MSKLDELLTIDRCPSMEDHRPHATPAYNCMVLSSPAQTKAEIKALILELIGDMEHRETSDMSLDSWTPEDYKAFGRNELKGELMKKVAEL